MLLVISSLQGKKLILLVPSHGDTNQQCFAASLSINSQAAKYQTTTGPSIGHAEDCAYVPFEQQTNASTLHTYTYTHLCMISKKSM